MRRLAAAAAFAVTAGPALAHTGQGIHGSAMAGLSHPVLGSDHLLAIVAIGLLAATKGGAARIALPAAFVAAMGAGIALGAAGLALPLVEPMILASILVLGAFLALAVRPSLLGGLAMAALFGLFHGAAHGAAVGDASVLPFAVGVLAATASLHAVGLAFGMGLVNLMSSRSGGLPLRFLGLGLGLGGVALGLG